MSSREILVDYLEQILEACARIERRFEGVVSPADFEATEVGVDKLDAICMMLIAIGENLKKLDEKTDRRLLARYPLIPWGSVKRTRDVISHGYFDVDVEVVFDICRSRLPQFKATVRTILDDVQTGLAE